MKAWEMELSCCYIYVPIIPYLYDRNVQFFSLSCVSLCRLTPHLSQRNKRKNVVLALRFILECLGITALTSCVWQCFWCISKEVKYRKRALVFLKERAVSEERCYFQTASSKVNHKIRTVVSRTDLPCFSLLGSQPTLKTHHFP